VKTDVLAPGVRLDVWLWAARFFKTRALAKKAIEGGKVELNQAAGKASKAVRVGDRLNVARGEERFDIEVAALGEQRGSAAQAQSLYRETEASRELRMKVAEERRTNPNFEDSRGGKPSKRDRRKLDWLRGLH